MLHYLRLDFQLTLLRIIHSFNTEQEMVDIRCETEKPFFHLRFLRNEKCAC